MIVAIIAAVTENGVIGRDGDMPWHLPADLSYFKQTTTGHAVIMGRRTFESFGGRPLPRRRNVVVTRNTAFQSDGVTVVHSLDEALRVCADEEEVFICGGASIYAEALALADVMHITRIHASIEGDTMFPDVDWDRWSLEKETTRPADERNAYDLAFQVYSAVPSD